jgi:pimeloyl-ACP methyl ester carboxylesterase
MPPNPTLVFVPGSWHGPEVWSKLTTQLRALGYNRVAVDLLTTQSNPDASISDDVKAVQQAIEAEIREGQNVVVVVHSYGGVVGPSAIKGHTRPKQIDSSLSEENTPSSGHVIGLVMMATGFMPTGVGFLKALGGSPPPFWKLDQERGLAILTVDPRELLYNDMPREEGEKWVSKLRDQSLKAFTNGTDVYSGWMDVPVWFLATLQDRGLPIEAQRMTVQMAKDAGADVTAREIDAGHSPMLSKPEETAQFIVEALTAFS